VSKQRKRLTEYERLRAFWYGVLKSGGFEDIEQDEETLKEWSSRVLRKNSHENLLDSWAEKAEYYDLATRFLNEYPFSTHLEKTIWAYHVEGISYRNTAKLLRKAKVARMKKDTVWRIVSELKLTMKKMYLK
jgi:hypothetical protein